MGSLFSTVQQAVSPFIPQCVDCVSRHYSYVSQLKDNFQALEDKKDDLWAKKTDVTTRVHNQEGPRMEQLEQVRRWVSKVDAAIREANHLLTNGHQEVQKLCIGGFCSRNVVSSYRFGKKVAKQLQHVTTLIGDGDFERLVERVPEEAVVERPVNPTTGLEGMLDKAWSCLMEKEAGMIGIYGMGGVGKTTLLTQIYNKLKSTPIGFDVVIWVVVSKDLRLEKIQGDIGKHIGFSDDQEWKNKSLDDKAVDIHNELSKKKFVLLLDDIWEEIDLLKLGIPNLEKKQSKTVFTTRSEAVCGQMGAQRWIRVDPLGWEKAWELFQKMLGQRALSAHPEIPLLARDVAKECAGLPLAINTIARSMASKTTPEEWRYACVALRKQASSVKDLREKVLSLLKHSYDNLPDDTYKSCFLYCSLFPEDYKIPKEELIDRWICEDFWDDAIRDKGYEIIGSLVRACLLEEEEKEEEDALFFVEKFVKMHDLVRDTAVWIACDDGKGKEKFLVEAGRGLKKAPEVKRWEGVKRLSLMTNDITEVTEVPTCPNLSTLLLCQNPHLQRISDGFSHSMDALTVLDLSLTAILAVPLEISKLVSLQYLNLEFTLITRLPPELKNLVKLKCLILGNSKVPWFLRHLGWRRLWIRIPRNLISSFKLLQVLRMASADVFIKDGEDGSPSENALAVEELLCLEYLSALSIRIRDNASLGRISSNNKLLHCIQELLLELKDCPESIEVSSLTGMKSLVNLRIDSCEGLQVITVRDNGAKTQVAAAGSSFSQSMITSNHRSFNSLTQVTVAHCPRLRDLTWLALAPSLRFLDVWGCRDMEEIINERKMGEVFCIQTDLNPPFGKLQRLRLLGLRKLKSIYGKALPFPSLERIAVLDCYNLKRLPLNSNSAKGCKVVILGDEYWWEKLEWEDEAAKATFQSCFVPK